ncbi:flavin-containing monooxygenase [Noviherbaspirillum massiliense]|uniref:flavin-containing monooxygenase n=1 Tax=Noviherbaspirillum massiliense TaxID=1465823 RepID=UPI000307A485|nr:NAD(P)/FAD-dependent oxidoreductase [Noviherbaspirillum massiliense]
METSFEHLAASCAAPLEAIVIGAGFGGIGLAIALKREGIHEFLILEKGRDVGGCWRDNVYPGAACDVPSHLYSFSFEPNWNWSRKYATQPEIFAYLKQVARKYRLEGLLRLNTEVASASYDEAEHVWRVELANGSVLHARMVVTATGQLSRPAYPGLPGLESFAGKSFHSATWDREYSLKGKRVAVIGTGASAIQFIPEVAVEVQHLKVFQRSPAYVIPRSDRAYRDWEKAMFHRFPFTMKMVRAAIYLRNESFAIGFTRFRHLTSLLGGIPFKRLLAVQVPDPELRRKLTPDYPVGCKRILISNDYLKALARPNVELVTEGIERITPTGIITKDGRQHEVDAIIFGTGFAATEFLTPMKVYGMGGIELSTAWKNGAEAYLGISIPRFPNFFMLYGPNTNLGHNSIVYMLESQIRHVIACRKKMRESGARSMQVRQEACAGYNARIQARFRHTVWNGCTSWYIDASGRNTINWPGFTFRYRAMTRDPDMQHYELTP